MLHALIYLLQGMQLDFESLVFGEGAASDQSSRVVSETFAQMSESDLKDKLLDFGDKTDVLKKIFIRKNCSLLKSLKIAKEV